MSKLTGFVVAEGGNDDNTPIIFRTEMFPNGTILTIKDLLFVYREVDNVVVKDATYPVISTEEGKNIFLSMIYKVLVDDECKEHTHDGTFDQAVRKANLYNMPYGQGRKLIKEQFGGKKIIVRKQYIKVPSRRGTGSEIVGIPHLDFVE